MKKNVYLVVSILFMILLISGCTKQNETKTLSCTLIEEENSITTTTVFKADFINNVVTKINTNKSLTLGDIYKNASTYNEIMDNLKLSIDSQYESLKNLSGVTYLSEQNNETSSVSANIDADLQNLDDNAKSILNISGALENEDYDEAKSYFESVGYICE